MRNPFRRSAEKRSLPPPENLLPLVYSASPITPIAALKIADVWAAVRLLADSVSSLPLHVYRKQAEGRERVDGGALVDLLEHPGPGMTQADLVSTLMTHVLTWGNAYLAKYRRDGQVVQLGLLDPDRIRPELEHGALKFRYSPGMGPQRMLTEADVVHVKGLSTDGITGLSPVTQASRVLGLSDELAKHAMAFFANHGAGPLGILNVDVGTDAEKLQAWTQALHETTAGTDNAFRILTVAGATEYMQTMPKMDDSQFVEQRRLAAQEIARVFRIPPHMLGAPIGDSLTYATVEQQSIDFVRYSLAPWLRRIELAISGDRDLTLERQFVKFEVDGLLRADAKTRSEVYATAIASGWLTVDEIRGLEDLSPLEAPQVLAPPAAINGSGSADRVPAITEKE